MATRRYQVTGRVQGVFFRASTRDVAERLGMSGRAVNRADGSVEIVATGSPDAHDRLASWLESGPPMAAVEAVTWEDVEEATGTGFNIG